MKIHKGDTVKIISGKDKGKSGKVMNVNVKDAALSIEGLNLFKKHVRPRKQGEKGQIVTLPRPLKISKVMLICPNCKKAVRVTKTRHCVKCKSQI
jgi:large subunit ribosomal protein L24